MIFLTSIIKIEKVLIIGDFNLHIDNGSCKIAADILSIIDSFNFTQHVSEPTHVKGHTLDLVLSIGLNANVHVEDVHISDHYCVFFNLECSVDPQPPKIKVERRIISPDAAERFSALFDPAKLIGCYDVDDFCQAFNSQCLEILDKVAPTKSNLLSPTKSCPWISEYIHRFKRNCRKMKLLWKPFKLEVHRVHLKELRASLNELLKTARKQYFISVNIFQ